MRITFSFISVHTIWSDEDAIISAQLTIHNSDLLRSVHKTLLQGTRTRKNKETQIHDTYQFFLNDPLKKRIMHITQDFDQESA
jgi:hypothetical protein